MKIDRIKFLLIVIFAFVPALCVFLEIIVNIIDGIALRAGQEPVKYPFDIVITEQTIYFSVWTALITSLWGFLKFVNYFKKENKNTWAESENVLTMVLTYNFISMLLYSCTMLISRDTIVGFNNFYSVIKSTFEHWVIPLLLMVYYFCLREKSKNVSIKKYAKSIAWKNMMIPVIYTAYVISRCVFIYNFSDPNEVPIAFPYVQVSPYNKEGHATALTIFITFLASIASIGSSYGLSILFEFIGSKTAVKFQSKFVVDNSLTIKGNKQRK